MPLFIGLISGTSTDAVDAALVDFEGERPRLVAYRETAYPEALRTALKQAIEQAPALPLSEYGRLDVEIGRHFAQAALKVMAEAGVGAGQVTAIGSHGQTLLHQPGGEAPFTMQVADPNVIAATTGIITVADFRRMDMALGGQGAPLAPAFHAHCFRRADLDRVVVNIGGIANITVLPADKATPVTGLDTGPGNCLLDQWAFAQIGEPFDAEGRWAMTGQVAEELLKVLLADEYFRLPPPKSTGREYFHMPWLRAHLEQFPALQPEDVQATLVRLTTASVGEAILAWAPATAEVLVCGGGARNPALMRALGEALPGVRVGTTTEAGVAPECVEAMMCAWLAERCLEGLPGNLSAVTGARRPAILGALYQPPP